MIERRSLEETLVELDDIVRRYRRGVATPGAADSLTHTEAITRVTRLRFTVGEALHLLRRRDTK
jgi:hypothetical protein